MAPFSALRNINRPFGSTVTPPELLELIAAGESQTMKFKTSFDKASIESLITFFDDSTQRKERFAYLLPALREVLLNAVVHRSCPGPGTQDSLFEASQNIAPLERRRGLTIACVEEIAWRNGFNNSEQLEKLA